MEGIKLSIIVPVYNIEQYLENCINSCLMQDIDPSEYEIIIVNDGSTDNCKEIIRIYTEKHKNIRSIDQTNQGLSMARNNGLKLATGNYIWFVDGDDSVRKNCLKEMINVCELHDVEILAFNREGQTLNENAKGLNRVCKGIDIIENKLMNIAAHQYLWKRFFLEANGLFFLKGIYHEDNEFIPRALYISEKCIYINKSFYKYYIRNGSITQTVSAKRSIDLIIVSNSLLRFAQEKVKDSKQKRLFYKEIGSCICSSVRLITWMYKNDRKQVFRELKKNKDFYKILMKRGSIKNTLEGLLFAINPILYFHCDRLVGKLTHRFSPLLEHN